MKCAKQKKKKILLLADDLRLPSGIGTISKEIVILTNSIIINEKNIKKIDSDLKNIQDTIKNLKPAKTITKGKK